MPLIVDIWSQFTDGHFERLDHAVVLHLVNVRPRLQWRSRDRRRKRFWMAYGPDGVPLPTPATASADFRYARWFATPAAAMQAVDKAFPLKGT